MTIYSISCTIDPQKDDLRKQLLKDHVAFIIENKDSLAFGGIASNQDSSMEKICYFLSANSPSEAEDFIRKDPYMAIYQGEVEILKFLQRIPEVEAGYFEALYQKLCARDRT